MEHIVFLFVNDAACCNDKIVDDGWVMVDCDAYGEAGVTSDTVGDLRFGRIEDGREVSARNFKLALVVYIVGLIGIKEALWWPAECA